MLPQKSKEAHQALWLGNVRCNKFLIILERIFWYVPVDVNPLKDSLIWQAPISSTGFSFTFWHSGVLLGHTEHLLVPYHWVQLAWYVIIADQHDVLQHSKGISVPAERVMNVSVSVNTALGAISECILLLLLCDDKLFLFLPIVRNQEACNCQINSCVPSARVVWYCTNKNTTSCM